MYIHEGFWGSVLAFIVAFVVAGAFTVAFKLIYQLTTPHKESALIRQGNVAAALVLGGAVLGYVIPLASALSNTDTLLEFVVWALIAGVIQIVTFAIVRLTVMKDLTARIEAGEIAPAVYLLSISLAVGVLNAACMTS
jgi:putative membrane protein